MIGRNKYEAKGIVHALFTQIWERQPSDNRYLESEHHWDTTDVVRSAQGLLSQATHPSNTVHKYDYGD